jgi:hypothetical protein
MCDVLRCQDKSVGLLRLTPEDEGYPLQQMSLCIEHQEAIRLLRTVGLRPEESAAEVPCARTAPPLRSGKSR